MTYVPKVAALPAPRLVTCGHCDGVAKRLGYTFTDHALYRCTSCGHLFELCLTTGKRIDTEEVNR
jgi:transposase-like protein